MKIAEAKALRNNLFMLDQKSMASQRNLFYSIRVLRSCSIIQDYYIKKFFYSARQNSKISGEKQITMHPNESPRIYPKKVKKPIGTLSKSQIRTCRFFQVLVKHVKVAERGKKRVNRKKDSPSKMILELFRKDAEELKKVNKKIKIYRLPSEKFDPSNFSYPLIPDKEDKY